MKSELFESFLRNTRHTEKSIASRICKGKKAEAILDMSFDEIVKNDNNMFNALNELQKYENPKRNPMQNSLRQYYKMINNKVFPKKKDYIKI